jgi:hypothetical protein
MLAHSGAAEFRIRSGLYPTADDVSVAVTSAGFLPRALRALLLPRHLVAEMASVVAYVVVARALLRWARRSEPARRSREAIAFVLPLVTAFGCAMGVQHAFPEIFSAIPSYWDNESPFGMLRAPLGGKRDNIRTGFMAVLARFRVDGAKIEDGAAALGLPPRADLGRTARCAPHPFAQRLDDLGRESGAGINRDFGAERIGKLRDLSGALFAGRARPLRLWHVLAEGLRSDDVHALNPAAPRAVAPFTTGLYEQARDGHIVVAPQMYQAGSRSSQGLAASTCGLGTMPFDVSLARDIGAQPLRCLPDILVDAGFEATFFLGISETFDNNDGFVRHHGIKRVLGEKSFVDPTQFTGWGVPDHLLLDTAWKDGAARSGPQYNLLVTMTNHDPFVLPAGTEALAARLAPIVAASLASDEKDRRRITTIAYTDEVVGRFLDRLRTGEHAADTLIVFGADHSTHEEFVWQKHSDVGKQRALSMVPFAIILPPALVESSADPGRVRSLVGAVNELLSEYPLSQNDVPRMLLALLSESRELRGLASDWRWHTLGGQATSPHFHVSSLPSALLLGIDAGARLFAVGRDGNPIPDFLEPAWHITHPQRTLSVTPTLHPIAALWSAFSSGYGSGCWEAATFRARE